MRKQNMGLCITCCSSSVSVLVGAGGRPHCQGQRQGHKNHVYDTGQGQRQGQRQRPHCQGHRRESQRRSRTPKLARANQRATVNHVYDTGLVVIAAPSVLIHTVHTCRVHRHVGRILAAIIVETVIELGNQRGAVFGAAPFSMRRCDESASHELTQTASASFVQDQDGIMFHTTAAVRVDVLHFVETITDWQHHARRWRAAIRCGSRRHNR